MRAQPVVVGEVGLQDPVQMTFAEDDDVVQALSTYGSYKALGMDSAKAIAAP